MRANAGSGKTHVLTQRVLRLLLSGATPESILCLTYTKAAAAEMRRRVSERLGRWAVLDDAALGEELTDLDGYPPTAGARLRARTLFVHALETPGGLKIQTIHAFCESVLHRFPVEAGVPFDFTVIEEHERGDMVLRAREQVLAGGLNGNAAVAAAVETLFEQMSDYLITEAVDLTLMQARKLRPLLADVPGAKMRLRALAGYRPERSRAVLLREIEDAHFFDDHDRSEVLRICGSKRGGTQFEDKLGRYVGRRLDAEALIEIFLTQKGTVPANFPKKALAQQEPALAQRLKDEAQRLERLGAVLKVAELVERSEALLDVVAAISVRYEAEKRARSLLDFDDLIDGAVRLFEDAGLGRWVRYKLDAGIDHILVDESQDTNPEQWKVVEALADEFFAGEGAVQRPRTIFAVGDEKQSIYSFLGAEPKLFLKAGEAFASRALAVSEQFREVPLHTSFRTLLNILNAVDKVFAADALRQAVLSEGVEHRTARAERGGSVTLWAPIQDQNEEPGTEWPLEVSRTYQSAPRQVAERMAREIAGWVRSRRPMGPRGRPVEFDDVLILVQARNALFREIIRALHRQQIPTPGADRLDVTAHIAVLDLLALGDVLLNPGDELELAALLRSPLFDLSEDQLYDVAHGRGDKQLWDALRDSPLLEARSAYDELNRHRSRLDFERPFNFYATVLYAEGGLRRFHRRFGLEVDDVFAEFLDLALQHEQQPQPGLQGFLAAMRARDVEIRRELGEAGAGVRVMTVHGAKGLEAPIVILADAATKPLQSQLRQPVHIVLEPPGPLLVYASGRDDHISETDDFRTAHEERQKAEYWRKLYVGMTRAEDELYVTGTLTRTGKLDGTWYEAIQNALAPESAVETGEDGAVKTITYPRLREVVEASSQPAAAVGPVSQWIDLSPLPKPVLRPVLTPSGARSHEPVDGERLLQVAAERARDPETARREGNALHALLQHLSRVPVADRDAVALKAAATLLPDLAASQPIVAGKALSILLRPELAHLFGPNSRAEVPFSAQIRRDGKPAIVTGRMDRLVVESGRVLVVDFKSDSAAVMEPAKVRPAYLTQVGLYALVAKELFPQAEVSAAILWTELESLLELDRNVLAEAVRGLTR